MRFVFDVNIIVSALLFPGNKPRKSLEIGRRLGRILISESIEAELTMVLARPKFDRYISTDEREAFLTEFLQIVERVKGIEAIEECRDPKDNQYLELAVSGKADCIITGDEDLLILHPFRGIPIVSIREFLEIFSSDR